MSVPDGARAGELIGLKTCEYQPASSRTKYVAECGTLEETTALQMQTTLYTPDPRLRGAAYGFADIVSKKNKGEKQNDRLTFA